MTRDYDPADWQVGDVAGPVKPDEPTGLGAVVEDDGETYVRCDDDDLPWRRRGESVFRNWSDFSPAVRVLSLGWSQ